ncbi:MAG TPA: hypothetical protein PLE74_13060 [Candidatus Cloacimonadota bacterium]|nr:hypothetical protein [Candidatus Cloacimonadota bacterium]HPT73198.1 hypothetical protein [Candidatus Cloacimonadota bacterium]
MKKILIYSFFLLVLLLVLFGCQNKQTLTGPKGLYQVTDQKGFNDVKTAHFPIYAGKDVRIGTMSVSNNRLKLIVTYTLNKGWYLQRTYLQVAGSLPEIPQDNEGTPICEKFQYSMLHNQMVTKYTYHIPLKEHSLETGKSAIIVAYATVTKNSYPIDHAVPYAAWGGDNKGNGSRLWYFIKYMLGNNDTPDVPDHESNS